MPSARRTNSAATACLFFSSYWCFWPLGSTPARHGVSRLNPGEEVPTLRSEVFLPLPLLPTSCRLPRPAGPRMELRRGGVGSQAAGRRMDGDCRDGGCGSKDAGSEDYENLPTSASVSTHMTAGAMAGILEHSIMYPVDSVKVRHAEDCGGKKPGEQLQQRARLHPAQLQPRAEPRSHAAGSPGRGDRPGLSPGFGACSRGSGKAHHVRDVSGECPQIPPGSLVLLSPLRSQGTSGEHSVRGFGCGSVGPRGRCTCAASEGAGGREALAALLRETYPPPFPGRAPSGPDACLLLWVGLGSGEEQATLFRRFPRLRAALWGVGVGDTGSATLHVTPPFPPSSARRQWDIQGSLLSVACRDVDLQTCTVRLRCGLCNRLAV